MDGVFQTKTPIKSKQIISYKHTKTGERKEKKGCKPTDRQGPRTTSLLFHVRAQMARLLNNLAKMRSIRGRFVVSYRNLSTQNAVLVKLWPDECSKDLKIFEI